MFLVPVSRGPRPLSILSSRDLSRLLDNTFDRFVGATSATEPVASRSPALDVAETDHAYTVKLDMPGVSKEDVKISVDGRQVTVQAQSQSTEEKKADERIVYRERSVFSYARTFTLPLEVDQSEANAKLDQGVLTLTLPKRVARSAAQIAVN